MKLSECWVGRVVTGKNFTVGHISCFGQDEYGEQLVVVNLSNGKQIKEYHSLLKPYEEVENGPGYKTL